MTTVSDSNMPLVKKYDDSHFTDVTGMTTCTDTVLPDGRVQGVRQGVAVGVGDGDGDGADRSAG